MGPHAALSRARLSEFRYMRQFEINIFSGQQYCVKYCVQVLSDLYSGWGYDAGMQTEMLRQSDLIVASVWTGTIARLRSDQRSNENMSTIFEGIPLSVACLNSPGWRVTKKVRVQSHVSHANADLGDSKPENAEFVGKKWYKLYSRGVGSMREFIIHAICKLI